MTNANAKATCEAAGMRYPCYRRGADGCTYRWTSDCITFHHDAACETFRALSSELCGRTDGYGSYCQSLDDTFVSILGWYGDGAYGVDYDTHNHLQGANYNNMYALCAGEAEASMYVILEDNIIEATSFSPSSGWGAWG
uniref:Uncharacterized protein n=1 Tax=Branchiostoma floridae TaxID=7739 RepID=C3ZDF7_BRAFL|eukprot:XP_002592752.1 hypothetical protein BRAFLDRAFT_65334 [Branchiostoma floridae]